MTPNKSRRSADPSSQGGAPQPAPADQHGVPDVDRDDLVRIAREWAAECDWPEPAEDVAELPDEVVLAAVARHYGGGLAQLVDDFGPLLPRNKAETSTALGARIPGRCPTCFSGDVRDRTPSAGRFWCTDPWHHSPQ